MIILFVHLFLNLDPYSERVFKSNFLFSYFPDSYYLKSIQEMLLKLTFFILVKKRMEMSTIQVFTTADSNHVLSYYLFVCLFVCFVGITLKLLRLITTTASFLCTSSCMMIIMIYIFQISQRSLFKLVQSLEEDTKDKLDILELVIGDKPLKTLVR